MNRTFARVIGFSSLWLAASAAAQPATGGEPAPAPAPAKPSEPAPSPKPANDKPGIEAENKDEVRVRGGFSLNGGVLIIPDNPHAFGGVIGLAGRIGVQLTHLFSIYYQNSPFVTLIVDTDGILTAGAVDYNTALVGFTFGHFFDLGLGGGADIIATYVCKEGAGTTLPDGTTIPGFPECSSGVRVAPGAHGRLAFELGSGPTPESARRAAFSLGVDVHPSFIIEDGATHVLMTLTAGIGGEWY